MKRILFFLLVTLLMLSVISCGSNKIKVTNLQEKTENSKVEAFQIQEQDAVAEKTAPQNIEKNQAETDTVDEKNYEDEELRRAVALGIGEYREENAAVTSKEFMQMLDLVVELSDETVLSSWKQRLPEARNSGQSMTRGDGMFALFCAAESLGSRYMYKNIGQMAAGNFWENLGNWEGISGAEYAPNQDLFPWVIQEQAPAVLFNPQDESEDRCGDALMYSFSRKSLYSGKIIFDYAAEQNSMRTADPFLYTEALLAALRLHDSALLPEHTVTDSDKQILEEMKMRREVIRNSLTEVEVSGTCYYVSTDGNDQNDGLSPQTPWATLEKVSDANLQPGDGVFF